jgi:predicted HTH transcriptional regulator
MFETDIRDLKLEHMQELIENKVLEGKEIEYKRDKIGNKDNEKKEFLQDVSSFANSGTGYIILGIDEGDGKQKGFPISIVGIEVSSLDEEKASHGQIPRSSDFLLKKFKWKISS